MSSDGNPEGCSCFQVNKENWLCFDCREMKLLRARACWEGEMLLGSCLPYKMERLCRCGETVKESIWEDGVVRSVWSCVNCEGLRVEARRELSHVSLLEKEFGC